MQEEALAELDARAVDAADADAYTLCLYPPGMAPGRRRHRRRAAQGPLSPPGDRVRARRRRRAQGLRPLDRRLPPARRAGPRRQARARDCWSRFGGHAYAAGLTLAEADLPRFAAAFEAVAREQLLAGDLAPHAARPTARWRRASSASSSRSALRRRGLGPGLAGPGVRRPLRRRRAADRRRQALAASRWSAPTTRPPRFATRRSCSTTSARCRRRCVPPTGPTSTSGTAGARCSSWSSTGSATERSAPRRGERAACIAYDAFDRRVPATALAQMTQSDDLIGY